MFLEAKTIVFPLSLVTGERVLGDGISPEFFLCRLGGSLHHLLQLPAAVLSDVTQNDYAKVMCSRESSAVSYISVGLWILCFSPL